MVDLIYPTANVIGFCGRKRAGKNLAAAVCKAMNPHFQICAFGDALKIEAANTLGISVTEINADKELYRPFLQWYGTEYKRRSDNDYWVRSLSSTIVGQGMKDVLVADVRFSNEMEWIGAIDAHSGYYGVTVYVDSDHPHDSTSSHSSEQVESMKDACDYYVKNFGTPDFIQSVADLYLQIERDRKVMKDSSGPGTPESAGDGQQG